MKSNRKKFSQTLGIGTAGVGMASVISLAGTTFI